MYLVGAGGVLYEDVRRLLDVELPLALLVQREHRLQLLLHVPLPRRPRTGALARLAAG